MGSLMGVPAREPPVRAGDIVEGRYRILSALGEGGMGTVFLAEHSLIKRRVAIKILHSELATDANVVERFMNEARAAGTLGHPNIVESTDMGFTHDHVPYIVFEYLEGSLLTDEIYRVRGMPVRRAVRIAQQIASALEAAHKAGIIHRDLKSDNVFLTDKDDSSDHVKVLDFGISRFQHVDEQSGGLVMGTPEFMAPEQITAPDDIDSRVDIYALGVMLYEMLAARRPFSLEEFPRDLLERVVRDAPPPLARPEVPHALAEMILGRMLAKNREDRYATMSEVEAALDQFVSQTGSDSSSASARRRSQPRLPADPGGAAAELGRSTGNQPVVRARTAPPIAPRAAKRPWALYGLAGLGLVVGVIGVGVGLHRPGAAPVQAPVAVAPPAGAVTERVVPPVAPPVAVPVAAVDTTPKLVAVTFAANVPGAKVSVRRRNVKTPATLQLAPNSIIESLEVSAPDHKTVRYWLTLDRPTTLTAKLPRGDGTVEATDDQILVALGELAAPAAVAVVAPDPTHEPSESRAHARARTNRRIGRDATDESSAPGSAAGPPTSAATSTAYAGDPSVTAAAHVDAPGPVATPTAAPPSGAVGGPADPTPPPPAGAEDMLR